MTFLNVIVTTRENELKEDKKQELGNYCHVVLSCQTENRSGSEALEQQGGPFATKISRIVCPLSAPLQQAKAAPPLKSRLMVLISN